MKILKDEDLQAQGVERQGMTLRTTRPASAGTTTGTMETHACAHGQVPTLWETVVGKLQDAAGWIGLLLILGVFVAWIRS